MRKFLLLFSLLLLSASIFANGLSLNSPGPRALAMGGAFIAVASDGSAIYWNPAGLCGQDNGIKAILTDIIPIGNYSNEDFGIDADTEVNHYFNPNIFFNYTMNKFAFGFGLYVPAGLGTEYDGADLQIFSAIPGAYAGDPDMQYMSKIGVVNFSPAVAYQLTDKLSFGVAANIYYAMFDLKRFAATIPNGQGGFTSFQYSEESTGMGYGATFGILYQASEMVKLGFTLRTPTEVTMEGSADNDLMAAAFAAPAESDFDRDVTWPLWIGGGIALKLHEKFTLSLDAQYSRWSELDILKTEYKDSTWALVTGASGDDEFVLDWEDATQIRLGWEYQASPCFAVRGGYYYDPAPAPNETLNILFPSMTNSVITAGLGYCKGKIDIDFGIEYLFAIERSALASEHNMPGLHHMDVLAYSLGVGYKF